MSGKPIHRHDEDRLRRIGIAEAVFCSSKSADQIAAILREAAAAKRSLLLTHLDEGKAREAIDKSGATLDYDGLSRTAILGRPAVAGEWAGGAPVEIVTGGTSDLAVAGEAHRTLAFHGVPAELLVDVGVAGLHRLLDRLEALRKRPILIVCAGLDAALPTVLAGLVGSPIIAVPTSIGYGVAKGGRTALNSCLASCAPGVMVMNIDNGFGAACAALRLLHGFSLLTKQVGPYPPVDTPSA
jgi:hypothetical protein